MPDATEFEPLVGTTFTLPDAGGVGLELTDVDVVDQHRFALLFRGPASPVLAQAMYTFDGGVDTPRKIFIVPIRADDDGAVYEAVFAGQPPS